ncbi:MAG: glycosyltransferase [Clostridia bacterium]|nr:glycosyltransferase [Clostridia bacterium]
MIKKTEPSFSIITVTYNSSQTVAQAIESVLNQTYLPKEYFIIDGLSTDDTLQIARQYEQAFFEKGVRYQISSEKDYGIYDAMNKGIAKASGDLIGMINSDDWYEPDALKIVAAVYMEKGFDLFFADLKMHRQNGTSFIKLAKNRAYATSRDWNHPTTFVRKELYQTYQYRCETIHDDYDLILRLKKAGVHIEIEHQVLANFRMNGTSHDKNIKNAMKRVGIKYKIYRQNGYSRWYLVECLAMELAKLIAG